jgi:hypothetical protein
VKLTNCLHLVSMLGMSGAVTPLTHTPLCCAQKYVCILSRKRCSASKYVVVLVQGFICDYCYEFRMGMSNALCVMYTEVKKEKP